MEPPDSVGSLFFLRVVPIAKLFKPRGLSSLVKGLNAESPAGLVKE